MPIELKPHWEEDAPEFAHEGCGMSMLEAYEWLKAHGLGSRCPDAEDLICLMEIADQEGAPHSIRHFLWSMLHYPEEIIPVSLGGKVN